MKEEPFNNTTNYDAIENVLSPEENCFLTGHDKNFNFFNTLVKKNRLPHAFLFIGKKGIGRASFAMHVAWNIFQKNDNFVSPNNLDGIWRQMAQKTYPDFLHVKRGFDIKNKRFKSAITVDDIRNIHHFLEMCAGIDHWRVILIDEADDMNLNAANALLKVLESPPEKVLFILLSSAPARLLSTIRSRCQFLRFSDLEVAHIVQILRKVVTKPLEEEDKVLLSVAEKAQGSARDAALLLLYEGVVFLKHVENLLNEEILNYDAVHNLANDLSNKNNIVKYDQFIKDILYFVANKAKANLNVNDRAYNTNANWATLYFTLQNSLRESESYNLDKKSHIILIMDKIHKLLHAIP